MKKGIVSSLIGLLLIISIGLFVYPGFAIKSKPLYLQYNFTISDSDPTHVYKIKFSSSPIAGTQEYTVTNNTIFKIHTAAFPAINQKVEITVKLFNAQGQSIPNDANTYETVGLYSNEAQSIRGCALSPDNKEPVTPGTGKPNSKGGEDIMTRINGPIGVVPPPPSPITIVVE